MATTDVPDGGAYTTAEHLRAQRDQLDPKTLHPLPSLAPGEQAATDQPAPHDTGDQSQE